MFVAYLYTKYKNGALKMEHNLIKEWVKPELKVINFAKTNETVLLVSFAEPPSGKKGNDCPPEN